MVVREHLEKEYGHINPMAHLKYNVLLGVFGVHWWGGRENITEIKEILTEMLDACDLELTDMENDNA